MKRRRGGDCGGSQQRVVLAALINYIQKVVLQSDLEALPPDFPWYLLLCQFLEAIEADFWYRIWKKRADLAERSVFWRFYFYVYIFIGLHFIFLLYFLLEIAILMRKGSKSFQTTKSTAYLKLLKQSAEQAVNFWQSKMLLNILNIGKNWVKMYSCFVTYFSPTVSGNWLKLLTTLLKPITFFLKLPLNNIQVFQPGLEVWMALQVGLGWGITRRLAGTSKVAVGDIRDKSDSLVVWWGRGFDGKERNLKNSKRHQVAQIGAVAKITIVAAVLEAMGHFYQDDFTVENTASHQWTFSLAKSKRLHIGSVWSNQFIFLVKMM